METAERLKANIERLQEELLQQRAATQARPVETALTRLNPGNDGGRLDDRSAAKLRMLADSLERSRSAALSMQRLMHGVATSYQQRVTQAMEASSQFAQEASVLEAGKSFVADLIRQAEGRT